MSDDLQLIEKIKSYNSYVDEKIIKNAYRYASEVHKSQKRHSGDPYISHPLAVANILAELKLDGPTITTALLHDTIEDTDATFKEVKKRFGNEIAELVDGVTKISALETVTSGAIFLIKPCKTLPGPTSKKFVIPDLTIAFIVCVHMTGDVNCEIRFFFISLCLAAIVIASG